MLTKAAFIVSKNTLNIMAFYFNVFSKRDAKLNFQHHYSSLQSRMILQKY